VTRGSAVLLLDDPQLRAEAGIAQARVDEAKARYAIEQFTNPGKAEISKRQLEQEQAVLDRALDKLARLVVRAQADGVLSAERPQDMPGRYFKKGELIAHVLDRANLLARVVVQQDDIDLVRSRLKGAQLRFADAIERTHTTRILREVPGAQNELPTSALSAAQGGPIATDPQDSQGTKALVRVFSFDMQLPESVPVSAFGERVHVRFELRSEPLASQAWRRVRQTLLSHLAV
jgi:putative peptide zinc metalloprotease protein